MEAALFVPVTSIASVGMPVSADRSCRGSDPQSVPPSRRRGLRYRNPIGGRRHGDDDDDD